jgi:hypothetical protein
LYEEEGEKRERRKGGKGKKGMVFILEKLARAPLAQKVLVAMAAPTSCAKIQCVHAWPTKYWHMQLRK